MSRFSEYFGTLGTRGDIVMIAYAYPPHELLDNQVMLTENEYKLLRVVRNIEEAEELLGSIKWKIERLPHDSSIEPK